MFFLISINDVICACLICKILQSSLFCFLLALNAAFFHFLLIFLSCQSSMVSTNFQFVIGIMASKNAFKPLGVLSRVPVHLMSLGSREAVCLAMTTGVLSMPTMPIDIHALPIRPGFINKLMRWPLVLFFVLAYRMHLYRN